MTNAAEKSQSKISQTLLEEQLRTCSLHGAGGRKARIVVERMSSEGDLLADSATDERRQNFRHGLMEALADGLVTSIGRGNWSIQFVDSLACVCRMTGMSERDGTELFLAELHIRLRLRAHMTTQSFAAGCLRQEDGNTTHFAQTILSLAKTQSLLDVSFVQDFREALLADLDDALPKDEAGACELQAVLDEALLRTHIASSTAKHHSTGPSSTTPPRKRRAAL
jgi:hypothetical protein